MHSKKKQRVKFEFISNRIPSWRTPGLKRERMENEAEPSTFSTSSTKRVKNDTDNNFYIEALSNEMRIRLTNKIRTCLDNKDDINTLKTQCLNATRLERGTATTAEQKANVPATIIEKFLKRQKKGNVEYWLDFVAENFDSIHLEVNRKRKGKGKEKEVEKEIVSGDNIPLNKVLDTLSSNHNTDEVRVLLHRSQKFSEKIFLKTFCINF